MVTHEPGRLVPAVHDRDHIRGPADAPATLVIYGDFQCAHCAAARPIVAAARARLGNQLRVVFRNYPLTRAHPHALHAAEAAESVAAHAGNDAYWAMHDALFAHQHDAGSPLDDANLVRLAAAAGADPNRVRAELASGTYEALVRADFISGVRSGVNGTPTFYVNGDRYDGDWRDAAAFISALEAAAGVPRRRPSTRRARTAGARD